jgi:threonine/homoserine/homoserine lactone efflux protein
MMFVIAFGLGSLVIQYPLILKVLNWCGAAFLLWLAWKIAFAKGVEPGQDPKPVGFVGGALFQWVNPKSWLVCVSAAGTFLHAESGSPVLQSAAMGGLFILAALPSCFLWLAFGAAVQRFLLKERRRRIFNIAMAVLLAASIAMIVHF